MKFHHVPPSSINDFNYTCGLTNIKQYRMLLLWKSTSFKFQKRESKLLYSNYYELVDFGATNYTTFYLSEVWDIEFGVQTAVATADDSLGTKSENKAVYEEN